MPVLMIKIVTPCVGVWIETALLCLYTPVCIVTPCVGVWIETYFVTLTYDNAHVTPCVGVWIETHETFDKTSSSWSHPAWVCGLKLNINIIQKGYKVTPCVGVWIETYREIVSVGYFRVTPCVGVWIETSIITK